MMPLRASVPLPPTAHCSKTLKYCTLQTEQTDLFHLSYWVSDTEANRLLETRREYVVLYGIHVAEAYRWSPYSKALTSSLQ
jgi:hypothetical protein